jgi:ATP-binding cassette subfamily B protein
MRKKSNIIRNNIFVIKKIISIDAPKVIFDIIYQISTKFKMFLFGIFYPLFVFKAIENGDSFNKVLLYVGIALGINLLIDLYAGLYSHKIAPVKNINIMGTVNRELYDKSAQIEVSNYENPEFYEQYNRMMQNVQQRFLSVESSLLTCFFDCVYLILTMSIMINIDIAIIGFVIVPLLISFYIGSKINKTQYSYNEKQTAENRKKVMLQIYIFPKILQKKSA